MRKITVILILLFCGTVAKAQNEMFKALYMYNFTKHVEWPAEYKKGNFVIGVLGSTPVYTELVRISKKKTVGLQAIEVQKYSGVEQIGRCNLLYVPANNGSELAAVIKKLDKQATLIVTDAPGLASKGAQINFKTVNGDQKYEINPVSFSARSLKVSSYLLSLGIVVE